MSKYQHESTLIREIFSRYTEKIEPLSLDEAFLDVSNSRLHQGSATYIAQAIKNDIYNETGLTGSAGVAPNKFLAKIASDWEKPNGLTVITPTKIEKFMQALPVEKIFGVGQVTLAKLQQRGLYTCSDLQQLELNKLIKDFGRFGADLYKLCRGIDDRPVQSSRDRKSLSVEHTYNKDLSDINQCVEAIDDLFDELQTRLKKVKKPIKTAFIKIKYHDFQINTAQTSASQIKKHMFVDLLRKHHNRSPIRLLGVGVSFRSHLSAAERQLVFHFE